MRRLILASASPRRRDLLAQIGVEPNAVIPADIDESPLKLGGGKTERPRPYAERMAREKAMAVAARLSPDNKPALVLAADTVVCVGTRILPKTETREDASSCLALLGGRAHRVYSGVCIIGHDGDAAVRVVETRVKVRLLNDEHIADYLATGEWQGKAGGYAIQGAFARHIVSISGSYTNVVGLPLYETANLLTGKGWPVSGTPA